MVQDEDRWWWLPDGKGGRRKDLPFSYSLRATAGGRCRPRGGLTMLDDYLKANLASWDEAVGMHVASELYDVDGFKAGKTSLSEIELGELGPLVGEGTTLLHLQCHFGLDTLSWARRGAVVTGVDFSGEGIRTARALADEVGLSARATFVAERRRPPPGRAAGRFDVVFTSWGALIWLGDLERWAEVVARFLKPGGTSTSRSSTPTRSCSPTTPRRTRCASATRTSCTASRCASTSPATTPTPRRQPEHTVTFEWMHGFAEIIDPLLRRGLRLDLLHEFPYTVPGCRSRSSRRTTTACCASRATTTTSP